MRRVLLIVALLLGLASPASAAISVIGKCAAQTTSCTFDVAPSYGDLIVVWSHRDGNTTAPTLVAAYTNGANSGANVNSLRVAYKFANGTETTTSVWTNATSVAAVIYRGVDQTTPLGDIQVGGNASVTLSCTGLTLQVGDGTSWVACGAGHRTATDVGTNAPTGLSTRTSATDVAVFDSAGGKSSWTTQTATVNANSGWRTYTIEVRANSDPDSASVINVDDYLHLNTADANGTTLTATILQNGTAGPDAAGWSAPASGLTVEANLRANLASIHVRGGSTFSTAATVRPIGINHTVTPAITANLGIDHNRFATVASGWIYTGPADLGGGAGLYDYLVLANLGGNFAALQLNNGNCGGAAVYGIEIETNIPATTHSACITVAPTTTYWFTLYFTTAPVSGGHGQAKLAMYNTGGTQLAGSPVTVQAADDLTNQINLLQAGQNESSTGAYTSYLQSIGVDWTTATWPLAPTVAGGGASCTPTMMLLGVGRCGDLDAVDTAQLDDDRRIPVPPVIGRRRRP